MDGSRVASLVDGLASAYEAGLDFYTKWKQKQERENHYHRPARKSSAALSKCALSTSLDISSHRIKATYQVGFALIGPEFAVGDAPCTTTLSASLTHLETSIAALRQRLIAPHPSPLDLHDLFHISESTRTTCISALAEQYARQASNRPTIPQDLPIPKSRPAHAPTTTKPSGQEDPVEFDRQTAVWSTSSGPPQFQSEPPSPPPTPKSSQPDDTRSCAPGAASERLLARRPENSVFSIFCPEAMALQVDPARAIPAGGESCRCGYRWDPGAEVDRGGGTVLLKDGFRMTGRFLGKSHCDLRDGGGGYGCVLCTSTGCAETYGSVEGLRVHVNGVHTKWQMLHDRDMT